MTARNPVETLGVILGSDNKLDLLECSAIVSSFYWCTACRFSRVWFVFCWVRCFDWISADWHVSVLLFLFLGGGSVTKKKWCQHERVVVCLVGNLNQLQRVRKGPPLVSAAVFFVRIVSLKICCRNGSTMLDCWPGYRGMVGNGHKLFLLIADVPFLDSGDSVYCRIG